MASTVKPKTKRGEATRNGDHEPDYTVKLMRHVACFFDVPVGTIRTWRQDGLPGAAGHWDLKVIFDWFMSRKVLSDKEPVSPGLELLRIEKSKIAQLQRLQMERELVHVAVLHDDLMQIFGLLRQAGEQLQRMFGSEAQDVLNEYLDECERRIQGLNRADGDAADNDREPRKNGTTNGGPSRERDTQTASRNRTPKSSRTGGRS